MRPENLKTKIFLDSGDSSETKETINLLGFLDGQTTNPSLISKNPEIRKRLNKDEKFSKKEVYKFYREIVQEISMLIPKGSVSIEVYADESTTAEMMLPQAKEMFKWIHNAHIKFPITTHGLIAAHRAVKHGLRINMTLCFTQDQAAAVYSATKVAKKNQVFISPFVGRLDDIGESGMSLVKNILKMYQQGDGHVEILTASVRNLDHFLYALQLGSDIITAPFKVLKEWKEKNLPLGEDFIYQSNLKEVEYKGIDLNKNWQEFNISHELVDQGIEKFSQDWQSLIK